MRHLTALLLLLVAALAPAETITTVNCQVGQSGSWLNHVTQVAISATEVGVTITVQPGYWVTVQLMSPTAWTYRGTSGSSTDAEPLISNAADILRFTGTQTFYAVAGSAGTLYVHPLSYSTSQ